MVATTPSASTMPGCILIATDGSDDCAGAIRTGIALAHSRGARLIGLSIALDNPEYNTLVPNLHEVAEARARAALQSFIDEAGASAEATTRRSADPADGVVAAADELSADLIVMAESDKNILTRMMVGDTTAKVIGRTARPVLVVPRSAHIWDKRILLATDGSPHSEAAAELAGHFARQAGLPVSVVSVVTSSHSDARRKEAERAVAAAMEHLTGQGLQAEGQMAEGRPDEAIVKAAESAGADLIVVGSHGRTGLTKILLGSVAERVIGHAACPVLVVKA
ncbi:universal stress protein [Thiobacillus sp.]|uniref:universal stress protein n=1 Tax=Thiobacillus sp. TaxID=924 RepID=UPI0025EA1BA0|nr:universal stress protein [Thiobacillus sp.]MBT9541412.1 universal stress protein [Thiobacillus sp.]